MMGFGLHVTANINSLGNECVGAISYIETLVGGCPVQTVVTHCCYYSLHSDPHFKFLPSVVALHAYRQKLSIELPSPPHRTQTTTHKNTASTILSKTRPHCVCKQLFTLTYPPTSIRRSIFDNKHQNLTRSSDTSATMTSIQMHSLAE